MTALSVDLIKELRHMTSASVIHCKQALEEAGGDVQKAADLLRRKGLEIAAKKGSRAAKEGRIESYVHLGNKIGVLLEVNCESDFVARNNDFCQFTRDLAMQIAASSPSYVKREDVPADILEQEPDSDTFAKDHCLMEQPFVKDPGMTINDYLVSVVSKLGENIVVRRFQRYKIGE